MGLTFDGVDDVVTCAGAGTWAAWSGFTIASIVYRNSTGTIDTIFDSNSAGSGSDFKFDITAADKLRLVLGGATGRITTSSLSTGWYFLAATKATGTATPTAYIGSANSFTPGSESMSGTLPDNGTAAPIAESFGTSSLGSSAWDGDIVTVAIWNRVLSADEMLTLLPIGYRMWWTVPGCVRHYVLDAGSTSTLVRDQTGSGSVETARTGTSVSTRATPFFAIGPGAEEGEVYTGNVSVNVVADALTLTLSVPTPTITTSAAVTLSTVSPSLTVPAPTVAIGATVTPGVVQPVLTVPVPSISTQDDTNTNVAVPVVQPVLTVPVPTIGAGASVTPSAVAPSLSIPTPTIVTSASVTLGTVSLSLSVPGPTVVLDATASPATVTPVLTVPTPSVAGNADAVLDVVSPALSIPAPSIGAGASASPPVVQPVLTIPVPFIPGDVTLDLTTVQPVLTVPAPNPTTFVSIDIAVVSLSLTVLGPTVATGATLGLTTVQPVLTIGSLVPGVESEATPATVALFLMVPTPTIFVGVTNAAIDPVQPALSLPTPNILADARVSAPNIALAVVVYSVIIGALVAPPEHREVLRRYVHPGVRRFAPL